MPKFYRLAQKNHLAILRLFKFANLARRTIIRSMLNFSSFLLVATTARKAKPLNHLTILCLDSLRSNLKSNLAKFVKFGFKFYPPRPAPRKYKFKTRDALRQQSYVATLNFSFTAFATVASLCQSSLQARRDRFARYETATSCLYEEKRRRGRGIKGGGELFCFGFASQLQSRVQFKPPPLLQQSKKQPQTVVFLRKEI